MDFKLGESVFLVTDDEQAEYMVVSVRQFYGGSMVYTIGNNGNYLDVYECELSTEPDALKLLNIRADKME
jgi:hypothetical protein